MEGDRDQVGTATAAASSKPARPMAFVGATLGRYRIDHELGAGAIGIVHAAFDPDLERRVALKVLRLVSPSREAKERLLREARAMARLAHPNVVTVYEVGTANGRDFIAMELIDGETLGAWLRSTRRTSHAIVGAFLAAGRGLAAAHAAAIVHRDFKPHNVLRGRDGRIVVTDFGLARDAAREVAEAPEATPARDVVAVGSPSPLNGLTASGALVGTPAYMAPEQWNGDAITAATDQFAYCVALWEALSGERPYRGANLAELSAQVACGPEALDASRIPRRFRGLLRRGLETDPARRWPSMEALLAGLVRAERRPAAAAAIAATAGLAAAVLVVALRASAAPSPACEPPARDPAAVWSPVVAAITRGSTSRAHEAVLDAAFRDWQATRDRACSAPPQVRHEQLRCLDQVLARFEVVRQAFTQVPGVAAEAIQGELVEPVVCRNPEPSKVPRLTLAPSRDVLRAYALYARSTTDDKPGEAEIVSAIDDPETQACARVIATLALAASSTNLPRVRSRMGDAVALADRCQDDRLRADLMIRDSPYHWELPMIGPRGENAIRQAENAAARVMQPGLEAALALQRLTVAARRGEWDRAFELAAQAFSGYRTRGLRLGQLRAVIARNHLRLVRAEPGDVEAIGGDVQQWRPLAVASHQPELARELDVLDGMARFRLGDVAAAHAELVQAWRAQHRTAPLASARRITGEVVDARGHPVPGATVAAAPSLSADSTGIGLPVFFAYEHYRDPLLRSTTSDASGRFVIEDVLPGSVIAAMRGDEGTRPRAIAERVTLVLEPTRTISGTVDLGRISHTRAQIEGEADRDPNDSFTFVAPVAPDGSFTIRGVPTGAVRIGVAMRDHGEFDQHVAYREIPASPTSVTGVRLEASLSPRTLDVIVRSTVSAPVEGAMVRVFAGKHSITSFDDLVRLKFVALQISLATPASERRAPEPVQDRVRPGDLVAHLEHALLGELTVCVTGLGGDLLDPAYLENTAAHLPQLAIRCAPVSADARVVELAVPPQPRFE